MTPFWIIAVADLVVVGIVYSVYAKSCGHLDWLRLAVDWIGEQAVLLGTWHARLRLAKSHRAKHFRTKPMRPVKRHD